MECKQPRAGMVRAMQCLGRQIPPRDQRHRRGGAEWQRILPRKGQPVPCCAEAADIAEHDLYEQHSAAACSQKGHADLGHALVGSEAPVHGRSRRANMHPRARGRSRARSKFAASAATNHISRRVMRAAVHVADIQRDDFTNESTCGRVQQTHPPRMLCPEAGSREASTDRHR